MTPKLYFDCPLKFFNANKKLPNTKKSKIIVYLKVAFH